MKVLIELLLMSILASLPSSYKSEETATNECKCHCLELLKNGKSLCKNIFEIKEQVDHVTREVEKRTRHIGDLSDLMERMALHEMEFKRLKKTVEDGIKSSGLLNPAAEGVEGTTSTKVLENEFRETHQDKKIEELEERLESQEILYKNLLKVVEDLKKKEVLPNPQPFVSVNEDNMLGDSNLDTRSTDDSELAKNVSHLLAKVEQVENMTSKVQEELKSERRVRRHLEENLNETRDNIQLLNDKFDNVSLPIESRNDIVEEITISLMENMNRTLLDEQLQKIHYYLEGVAYKNETRDLYENLEKVKNELVNASSGSTLQFRDELETLIRDFNNFRENITSNLTQKEVRMRDLEAKTDKLEALDEKMNLLKNSTELMHAEIQVLWKEIQQMQNETVITNEDTQESLREIYNSTQLVLRNLFNNFNNLSSETYLLKINVEEVKVSLASLKQDIDLVTEDLTNAENRVDILDIFTKNKLKDVEMKIQNATDGWKASLSAVTEQFFRDKRMENLVTMDVSCQLPHSTDDHLLTFPKTDSSGQMTLRFACRPIGRYVLSPESANMTCVDGEWKGLVPECLKLLDEHEIDGIETNLLDPNPCMYSFSNAPDPADCSSYFECGLGFAASARCPDGHLFSATSKMCEPAHLVQCQAPQPVDTLSHLIPTIVVDPDTVDKPYSLMGTGPRGELIVHPRTTFTLHCLYPETARDPPTWRFSKMVPGKPNDDSAEDEYVEKLDYNRLGPNRFSVTIGGASSQDSGVYQCVTPYGKVNRIEVIVKSVQCPPFPPSSESVPAFYRPLPEGERRVLSTQAEFRCRGGTTVSATCTAQGTWSRLPPTLQECPPEESYWGCAPISTLGHPGLIYDKDNQDRTVTFRCAPGSRLVGIAFSRCFNGDWTHTHLPTCIDISH